MDGLIRHNIELYFAGTLCLRLMTQGNRLRGAGRGLAERRARLTGRRLSQDSYQGSHLGQLPKGTNVRFVRNEPELARGHGAWESPGTTGYRLTCTWGGLVSLG